MQQYADQYEKKDQTNIQGALNRFKDFLTKNGKIDIKFFQLDSLLIEEFIEYLETRSIGEGAPSYYARFKKMLKHAYKKKIMKTNILEFAERKVRGKSIKKAILTTPEIQNLINVPITNNEIKKATIFTLMTGLSWIDIKGLKWSAIDFENKRIETIQRSKTKKEIFIPLNNTRM